MSKTRVSSGVDVNRTIDDDQKWMLRQFLRVFPSTGIQADAEKKGEWGMRIRRSVCTIALLFCAVGTANAADATTASSTSGSWTFSASLGHLSGQAGEYVYNEDGTMLSKLVWDMQNAAVVNAGLSWQMTNVLTAYGSVSAGLMADTYMDNYDWLGDPRPAEPNMHSWHDDTQLDHYITVDAGVSVGVWSNENNTVSLLGGFKYTDVKWTASGGCFDYQYEGESGCFPDGLKVISYQQRLPALYGGLGYTAVIDKVSLSLQGRAGMTVFGPEGDDDHWLRDLNFIDDLGSAPYVSLSGNAAYEIAENTHLFVSAAYDKFFEMRGPATVIDTVTGGSETADFDSAGADLYTLNVSAGVSLAF